MENILVKSQNTSTGKLYENTLLELVSTKLRRDVNVLFCRGGNEISLNSFLEEHSDLENRQHLSF